MGAYRQNKVIRFPGKKCRANNLRQIDLAEERLLARQARDAVKEWQQKRKMIRRAIERGARLEPGTRLARICTRRALIVK